MSINSWSWSSGSTPGPKHRRAERSHRCWEFSSDGEMIAELPYADIQCAFDGEAGFRNYDERGIAWTKTVRDDMAPFAT